MDQHIDKPLRIRRSHQEITSLLNEFEKAGMSVAEFSQVHNIGKATFHKWQSRYRFTSVAPGEVAGFTSLQITSSAAGTGAALFAEVKGIRLYQPVAATYLKELSL